MMNISKPNFQQRGRVVKAAEWMANVIETIIVQNKLGSKLQKITHGPKFTVAENRLWYFISFLIDLCKHP